MSESEQATPDLGEGMADQSDADRHPGRDEQDVQQASDPDALGETGPESGDPGAADLQPTIPSN